MLCAVPYLKPKSANARCTDREAFACETANEAPDWGVHTSMFPESKWELMDILPVMGVMTGSPTSPSTLSFHLVIEKGGGSDGGDEGGSGKCKSLTLRSRVWAAVAQWVHHASHKSAQSR